LRNPPFAAAPLPAVDITPARGHMPRFAPALVAMVGDEVEFAPCLIALDLDQCGADEVLSRGIGSAQLVNTPRYEFSGGPVEQSVIVDGVGMVHAAQQFFIDPIDGAAVAHHHVVDQLLVQHHFEGRFGACVDTHDGPHTWRTGVYLLGFSNLPWYSGILKDGPSAW